MPSVLEFWLCRFVCYIAIASLSFLSLLFSLIASSAQHSSFFDSFSIFEVMFRIEGRQIGKPQGIVTKAAASYARLGYDTVERRSFPVAGYSKQDSSFDKLSGSFCFPLLSANMVQTRSQLNTSTPTKTTSSTSSSSFNNVRTSKPILAIVGTGWGGFTLLQKIQSLSSTYRIVLLSPSRTMALTPLLASAACSIFDFRMAEEPIRRQNLMSEDVKKYQVWVQGVDLKHKKLKCKPAIGSNGNARETSDGRGSTAGEEFEVAYDELVLCPGSETNTFDTPGVHENCLMMRTVADAMSFRERILDCLELASLPSSTPQFRKQILHFIIIGGGPTGCELAAEVDELIHEHLLKIYPDLEDDVQVSVYDVADRMLGSFGEKLSEYAMEKFRRRGVQLRMGKTITGFEKGKMKIKEEGEVGFGVAVWCVGNRPCRLVEELEVKKDKGRILTNKQLQVLDEHGEVLQGVYALGDCADIEGVSLPTTAEVACQKAKWLAQYLGQGENQHNAFEYKNKAVIAYIGRGDGVVEGTGQEGDWTGAAAWAAWREGSLEWTGSWRRKVMVVVYWVLNKLDGREIARRR